MAAIMSLYCQTLAHGEGLRLHSLGDVVADVSHLDL